MDKLLQDIKEQVQFWFDLAKELYPKYNIKDSNNVNFNLKGRCAGKAFLQTRELRFNKVLFKENYKEFCERTIPHEVAHIIAFQIFGTKGHDYAWRRIMNDFGCDSTRCHSYDTENSTVRTIKKQYPYKCGCTTHMLTKIRHNRSIKHGGEAYRCRKCGQVLVYIPGDTK